MNDNEIERAIRERAFQIWIDEGQPSGRAREHWERAKAEIMGPKLVDRGEGEAPSEAKPAAA
jgi:hypothetical protein